MLVIVGYVIIILCVFGGYAASGGSLLALLQPFEFIIIVGAAVGSFVIGNSAKVIRESIKSVISITKGTNYTRDFYVELLSLFFVLTNKIKKDGVLSIENDVEDYANSPLFTQFPLIIEEERLMEFLCDHLRLIVTGRVNSMHLEELIDEDIETFEQEAELPIHAITKLSDSMPAFGIVAAVMGVVTTMQHIDGPPAELGKHVAAALVGTFLGVLIGYGFIGPIANILENRLRHRVIVFQAAKLVLLASVNNLAPSIAVEFARKVLYSSERPTSSELEQILKDVRAGNNPHKEAPTESAENSEAAK